MERLIELRIGDYYDDGHGKSHSILLSTSYNAVIALYRSIKHLLADIAESYEDNVVTAEQVKLLESHGANFKDIDSDEGENFFLDSDTYADLVLSLMRYEDPTFEYRIVRPEYSLDIGGYGLF